MPLVCVDDISPSGTHPLFSNGVCLSLSLSSSHQFDFGVLTTTVIAFVFTGYILSFVVDLLPSVRTRRHVPQGEKRSHAQNVSREQEMGQAVIEEPLTMDSTGPAAGYYRGQRI